MEFVEELEADVAHHLAFHMGPVAAAPKGGERSDGTANAEQKQHDQQAAAVGGLQRVVDQMAERQRNDPIETGFQRAGNRDEHDLAPMGDEIARQLSKEPRGAQCRPLFRFGVLPARLIHGHSRLPGNGRGRSGRAFHPPEYPR